MLNDKIKKNKKTLKKQNTISINSALQKRKRTILCQEKNKIFLCSISFY